ncbi:DUF3103 family protein [Pseudoalteromonas spongiae]|uniref:DUF3103 family protein n=1 Tax=Pseudoalteromonas spongiae TaxID=298657 RepID=UPI00026CDEA1|nr:DUF3103 family protein [Pseudoalteromonas spongiae]ATC97289.1 hypothetical protein PSPO_a0018 [Pseudoalteromonas spongiae UST010723-006]
MNKKIKSLLLSALALPFVSAAAMETTSQERSVQIAEQKRALALSFAENYARLKPSILASTSSYDLTIETSELSLANKEIQTLKQVETRIRSVKGLPYNPSSITQLRVADSSMLNSLMSETPLFAWAPAGNEKSWQFIEAFDTQGNTYHLPVNELPERPVLIVELDNKQALSEGISVLKKALKPFSSEPKLALNSTTQSTTNPIQTSVLKSIHLQDDEEPWVSGKAEVYSIVTGVSPSRDEPVLDIVDMPYLDYDGTTYNPNQIIIYWDRYRWQAADILMMEQDDNTNYKELASRLLDVATEILKAIPDPEVQGYAIIPQLTNKVLAAMPDSWFTNDDDYVDVYYTLFEGQRYSNHKGASSNATITLEPLTIQPR